MDRLNDLIESLDEDILTDAYTDDEVEAEIRAHGGDTEAMAKRVSVLIGALLAKRREAWRAEAQARLAERRATGSGLSADDVEAVYKAELPDSTAGWYAVVNFVTAHAVAAAESVIVRLESPPSGPSCSECGVSTLGPRETCRDHEDEDRGPDLSIGSAP